MSLIADIKAIQRHVGAEPDGVFGPLTAAKVLAELQRGTEEAGAGGSAHGLAQDAPATPPAVDERSLLAIGTLDKKCQGKFLDFILLAKATAATLGCDYVCLSGYRSWEEQDALFAKRPRVTRAAGGYSWHNFGIAADFGVFSGKAYLDETNPTLSEKVHRACAAHAEACGLEWGGSWKTFPDLPHYQIPPPVTLGAARLLYKKEGSIL